MPRIGLRAVRVAEQAAAPPPILVLGPLRELLRRVLGAEGVATPAAPDGAAAIAQLATRLRPVFLLVDRTNRDGAELPLFVALGTAELAGTPLVILSNDDEPSEDWDAGIFVVQPWNAAALLRLVRILGDRSEASRRGAPPASGRVLKLGRALRSQALADRCPKLARIARARVIRRGTKAAKPGT